MSQEIGVGGTKCGLGGRKFDVVLSEALEEGPEVVDVGSGVRVEDVVEIGGNAFMVFDDRINDLDEPGEALLP